ncbi:hypothetical protein [Deinococcus xinjiangensis]|uniref:hypothetical protein n=1 Tax=Deinococcus xinjiangensis TaxID=457454 RepID=UPI003365637F
MHRRSFYCCTALLAGLGTHATATAASQGLQFDVQPRVISKAALRKNDPFYQIPELRVIVSNPTSRPLPFGVSCGGFLPVSVTNSKGQPTPPMPHLACTQELAMMTIQSGQTVTLRSFSWTKIAHLPTGKYAWKLDQQLFPFILKP